MTKIINIKALKYPNILHYEWQGELLKQTEDYVLVLCKPGRKLKHYTKRKTFTIDNTSLEYYSLSEWFTVAMEIEQDQVISYYCNIAKPSKLVNNNLSFIDLDFDLIKEQNSEWQVVDKDEFEINSKKYGYSFELKESAIKALNELKIKVEERKFPFNESIIKDINYSGRMLS